MTTPILKINELTNNLVEAFAYVNQGLRDLESAANDILEIDLSSGDGAVTNLTPDFEMLRYGVFKATGNTVARELTFSAQKRVFIVHNSGSFALDVTIGTTTISVPAATAYRFYADGTADGLVRVQ